VHCVFEFPTAGNNNTADAHIRTCFWSLVLETEAHSHVAFVVDRLTLEEVCL
jgi:hypothetical protein